MNRRLAAAVAALVVAMGAVAVAVISSGGDSSRCGEVENVSEGAGFHVLPGAEVRFELSPPTSGVHELPAPDGGVHAAAIAEARQVSFLEIGGVILQYSDVLPPDDVALLEPLAAELVVVAPAARGLDDGAAVAFSAWGTRQLCTGLDLGAAERFVDDRAGLVDFGHDDGSG